MAPPQLLDDPLKEAEARRLLGLGYTTRSIGRQLGCSHNTIRLFAIKYQIPIGDVRERHKATAKRLILDEHKSVQEVAQLMQMKVATIYSYIKDDLEIRRIRQQRSQTLAETRKAKRNENRKAKRRAIAALRPPKEAKPQELSPVAPNAMSWAYRKPPAAKPLPPIDPASANALILEFLSTRGVTKCPTMFVAPTQVRQPKEM